jgi:hypothetical protein
MSTYRLPFVEEHLKYVLEQYPKAIIVDKNETFTWLEIEIRYAHEFQCLFYAGARYGLHQSLTIKNQQS